MLTMMFRANATKTVSVSGDTVETCADCAARRLFHLSDRARVEHFGGGVWKVLVSTGTNPRPSGEFHAYTFWETR